MTIQNPAFNLPRAEIPLQKGTAVNRPWFLFFTGLFSSSGAYLGSTGSGPMVQQNQPQLNLPALLASPPASSSAPGTLGTITWDTGYIYICTATNTWKRAAISTF